MVVEGGTALFWVHSDHLKRPVKMLDAAQNVVWEALYEPFGTVHSITGTAANDNRFPGQLFQLETGLAYNWHRHYDSTLGRYTQVDPLGLPAMLSDGPSVYGYVGQSPLMWIDPAGLEGERHRCVSRRIWKDGSGVSEAARKTCDRNTTGPLSERHGWSRDNAAYNRAVGEEFKNYCDKNGIDPGKMTPERAQRFVNQIKNSSTPEISNFNNKIISQALIDGFRCSGISPREIQ